MHKKLSDPMERIIQGVLDGCGERYAAEDDPDNPAGLDFYLPRFDVHIEVKRLHSPRIAEQTSRAENVIVAQGEEAVNLLADALFRLLNDE